MDWLGLTLPYMALGCCAGFIAGLFGVGGGLIIVPALVFLFQHQHVAASGLMHLALGTSLASIVVTSLASIHAHQRQANIRWDYFRLLTPGIIIGVLCGSWVADRVDGDTLRTGFSLFVILVAVQIGLELRPVAQHRLAGKGELGLAGTLIGLVSALVGIGGGTLTTPYLLWNAVSIRQAIGTSAACGLPIAVFGSIGYVIAGLDAGQLPDGSSGYIYWPAWLGIISTSMLFAPLGARLTGILPDRTLKRVFALLLVLVATRMLFFDTGVTTGV
jgi:uncharacterized membrane protein YfcA